MRKKYHLAVRMQVVRWVSDDFPGFIECQFTDARGHTWTFNEKAILTEEFIHSGSKYPVPCEIPCEVVGRVTGADGQEVVRILLEERTFYEDEARNEFEVFADQLVPHDGWYSGDE